MELALGFLFLVLLVELGLHAYDRNQWSVERKELLQRIQSPEVAQAADGRELAERAKPLAPIALDDDEGYEALRLRREAGIQD